MPLLLATLIADRMAQLGLNFHTLAARLGYANTNKGSRRIQSLMNGNIAGQPDILARLADALQVLPGEVEAAVAAIEAAKEQGYRDSFVPHAVIETERSVPSQVTFCAVTRGETALRISLDTMRPRASYAGQALTEIHRRTDGGRRDIMFFGPAHGFVVNYDWCRAIRFDLEGRALMLLARTAQVGESYWSVR